MQRNSLGSSKPSEDDTFLPELISTSIFEHPSQSKVKVPRKNRKVQIEERLYLYNFTSSKVLPFPLFSFCLANNYSLGKLHAFKYLQNLILRFIWFIITS